MNELNKRYEIKVYNSDGTIKSTINSDLIISKIRFTENINGGQGVLNLLLNTSFNDTFILNNNFIKVFLFDNNFKDGKIVYTGVIESINRIYKASQNQISYTVRGLGSLFTRIFYNNGSTYIFNVNQEPGQTVKDMITYFNTKYPGNWLNDGNVNNFGSSINIGFDFTKISDAINQLAETTGFYWFINATGTVTFTQNPVISTHKFTAGDDLQEITITEDTFNLKNKYILDFDSGQSINENITSQVNLGLREEYKNRTEIKDQPSADSATTSFILENKDEKIRSPIIVNNNFTRENLKPGDTIKILNLDYTISNRQIKKLLYSRDTSSLEVDEFDSIATVF